jgi:tetratricopeptide (TPR) repeat protein
MKSSNDRNLFVFFHLRKLTCVIFSISIEPKVNLEKQAEELFAQGEIDQAIATYEQITPTSARIFTRIATIFEQKKVNYESAIEFYEKALYIQEQVKIIFICIFSFLLSICS